MKQFSSDANLKGLCPLVIARTARLYSIIVFANEVKQSSNYTFINENLKNFLGVRAFKNFVPKGYYDIDWGNFEDKYNIAKLNLE